MYMAIIHGYDDVMAFHENEARAKQLAVKRKRELCPNDLEKSDRWTWADCAEYFGANVYQVENGTVIDNYIGNPIE